MYYNKVANSDSGSLESADSKHPSSQQPTPVNKPNLVKQAKKLNKSHPSNEKKKERNTKPKPAKRFLDRDISRTKNQRYGSVNVNCVFSLSHTNTDRYADFGRDVKSRQTDRGLGFERKKERKRERKREKGEIKSKEGRKNQVCCNGMFNKTRPPLPTLFLHIVHLLQDTLPCLALPAYSTLPT